MKNVVVLLGRLGNQLRCLALGHWLEQTTDFETWYDIGYGGDVDELLRLGDLGRQLRDRIVVRVHSWPVPHGWTQVGSAQHGSDGWPIRVVRDTRARPGASARYPTPHCDTPAWWYGHWADEYAVTFVPALSEALHSVSNRPSQTPFIGVSVRRGDMLTKPLAVPSAWFRQAIARLRAASDHTADLPIRVYSDDLAWCERHLHLGEEAQVAERAGPVEQLAQMSDAAALVVSRSSFSWWAAAVASTRRSAPVVYPAPWPSGSDWQRLTSTPAWIPLSVAGQPDATTGAPT